MSYSSSCIRYMYRIFNCIFVAVVVAVIGFAVLAFNVRGVYTLDWLQSKVFLV